MPTRTSRLVPLALAAALGVLAAACGGGAGATPPPSGVTTATPPPRTAAATAAAAPTATVDPVHAAWARDVCSVTAGFDNAVRAVQDNVDPTTLPLDQRIARAVRRYSAYEQALRTAAPEIARILAPSDVVPYQRALAGQVTALEQLFTEEIQTLPTAKSGADIDAMTADLQRSVDTLAQRVRAAAAALPPAAREAIAHTSPCGQLLG